MYSVRSPTVEGRRPHSFGESGRVIPPEPPGSPCRGSKLSVVGSGDSALYCPPLYPIMFYDLTRRARVVLRLPRRRVTRRCDGGAGPKSVIGRDAG